MRYLTWHLKWIDGYGYGPETQAAAANAHLESSMFVDADGVHLGYLTAGDVDPTEYGDYGLVELTQAAALGFAQAIAPTAYLLEDGRITVPAEPDPVE